MKLTITGMTVLAVVSIADIAQAEPQPNMRELKLASIMHYTPHTRNTMRRLIGAQAMNTVSASVNPCKGCPKVTAQQMHRLHDLAVKNHDFAGLYGVMPQVAAVGHQATVF